MAFGLRSLTRATSKAYTAEIGRGEPRINPKYPDHPPCGVRCFTDGQTPGSVSDWANDAVALPTLAIYTSWLHILLALFVASFFWRPAAIALAVLFATTLLPAWPLRWQALLQSRLFESWRRYFHFSFIFEEDLDDSKDYLFAQFPHGAFPLGPLLGATSMACEFPAYKTYLMAANSVFSVPLWRHFNTWLGAGPATRQHFKFLMAKAAPREPAVDSAAASQAQVCDAEAAAAAHTDPTGPAVSQTTGAAGAAAASAAADATEHTPEAAHPADSVQMPFQSSGAMAHAGEDAAEDCCTSADTASLDAAPSDSASSDAASSDTASPPAAASDAAVPGAAAPNGASPEAASPTSASPEAACMEAASMEVAGESPHATAYCRRRTNANGSTWQADELKLRHEASGTEGFEAEALGSPFVSGWVKVQQTQHNKQHHKVQQAMWEAAVQQERQQQEMQQREQQEQQQQEQQQKQQQQEQQQEQQQQQKSEDANERWQQWRGSDANHQQDSSSSSSAAAASSGRQGTGIGLVVGGIAEMFLQSEDHEAIYLHNRKGFVALALEAGIDIVPVYAFGNSSMLSFSAPKWLAAACRRLRCSVGLIYGRWGLVIPRKVPVMMAMGRSVKVGGPMEREDPQFEQRVREVHAQVVAEVVRLYDAHKERFGWAERPLVVL